MICHRASLKVLNVKYNISMQRCSPFVSAHILEIPWKSLLKIPFKACSSLQLCSSYPQNKPHLRLTTHQILGCVKERNKSWLKWSHLQFRLWGYSRLIHLCPLTLVAIDAAGHLGDKWCCLCSFSNSEFVSPCEEFICELWYQLSFASVPLAI